MRIENENEDNLMFLAVSEVYLKQDRLEEADDLFQSVYRINYHELPEKDQVLFLKVLYSWCKVINSEQSREIIRSLKIKEFNMKTLHYYILALRKKYLYPLILITWFFV